MCKKCKEEIKNLEIIKHLQKSELDIENGKTIPANVFWRELKSEYKY